jgi:hypothetical protein
MKNAEKLIKLYPNRGIFRLNDKPDLGFICY